MLLFFCMCVIVFSSSTPEHKSVLFRAPREMVFNLLSAFLTPFLSVPGLCRWALPFNWRVLREWSKQRYPRQRTSRCVSQHALTYLKKCSQECPRWQLTLVIMEDTLCFCQGQFVRQPSRAITCDLPCLAVCKRIEILLMPSCLHWHTRWISNCTVSVWIWADDFSFRKLLWAKCAGCFERMDCWRGRPRLGCPSSRFPMCMFWLYARLLWRNTRHT